MKRTFRIASAFMRHAWAVEPAFAEQSLPMINAYLAGTLPLKAFDDEDDEEEGEDPVARCGYALAATADNGNSSATQNRYALDDPELPDNSIFVLDIRGAIFKESTCCSVGTEDYVSLINQAYAHDKIIGVVCLIDSPGGQLSGTPTLYDAIRNPQKPTVSVVNEGLMASAAYWLACGSDFIYATQKTDQIGSIGVFVQFNDSTEQKAKLGIKTHTIYSDRSSEKNLPIRNALAGDDALLREDLNMAADLFREAVEQGRGDRLKPATKETDVFKGGVFYASKAIQLGLIDGFGNLDTALAKVVELHTAKASSDSRQTPSAFGSANNTLDSFSQSSGLPATAPTVSAQEQIPASADRPAPTEEPAPTNSNSNPNSNPNMFGFVKLGALAAIHGVAAADVTEAQINALNAELPTAGYNVAVISEAQFTAAQTLQSQLTAANDQIASLTAEVTRLGKQPGSMPTKVEKEEESTATEQLVVISETDAELARLKGKKI